MASKRDRSTASRLGFCKGGGRGRGGGVSILHLARQPPASNSAAACLRRVRVGRVERRASGRAAGPRSQLAQPPSSPPTEQLLLRAQGRVGLVRQRRRCCCSSRGDRGGQACLVCLIVRGRPLLLLLLLSRRSSSRGPRRTPRLRRVLQNERRRRHGCLFCCRCVNRNPSHGVACSSWRPLPALLPFALLPSHGVACSSGRGWRPLPAFLPVALLPSPPRQGEAAGGAVRRGGLQRQLGLWRAHVRRERRHGWQRLQALVHAVRRQRRQRGSRGRRGRQRIRRRQYRNRRARGDARSREEERVVVQLEALGVQRYAQGRTQRVGPRREQRCLEVAHRRARVEARVEVDVEGHGGGEVAGRGRRGPGGIASPF